ncbi:MAG: trimeric intracellular cation channel family protein [Verrucomicrobiota bacterium JB023]|nr:trimeric intracellular cation channel family protein [Verrucomicrobiota bacterium JB023]
MTPLQVIELIAVVSAAFYGVLLAVRTEMDVTGMFAVAFVAAFGGGTLRDVFLNREPLFWIAYPHYPLIVFGIALLASFLPRVITALERYLTIPDALGMGAFTITGASLALRADTTWFLASLFGVLTGCFGGVIAEIVCNRVPETFRPGRPMNLTCCFAGGWVFIIAQHLEMPRPGPMILGAAVVTIFRLLAVRFKWSYPRVGVSEEEAT